MLVTHIHVYIRTFFIPITWCMSKQLARFNGQIPLPHRDATLLASIHSMCLAKWYESPHQGMLCFVELLWWQDDIVVPPCLLFTWHQKHSSDGDMVEWWLILHITGLNNNFQRSLCQDIHRSAGFFLPFSASLPAYIIIILWMIQFVRELTVSGNRPGKPWLSKALNQP